MSGRHLVMPRGINVGRNNRVPMADLRVALTGRGCSDVVTILQSGSILVTVDDDDPQRTGGTVRSALADDFGVDVECVVRTADEVRSVHRADPLHDVADDPSRYLVTFFSAVPDAERVEALRGLDPSPEVLAVQGREAYVWTPDGVKSMRLSYRYLEQQLGVVATARNWGTVEKIVAKL